jgi:hypothetical protein
MIQLSDELIFAEGGRRYCFVHPDDPGKCVKTLSPRGNPQNRRKEAVWYKRLLPLAHFDDNLRELKSFHDLERRGEAVWDHFPRCYGIQPTSRGDGIVTDLIRNADGSISKTVKQYIRDNGQTEKLAYALEEFFDLFRREHIVTRDILHHNLVVQIHEDQYTIYMIDGFGSAALIPISRWFRMMGRRSVERKVRRFKTRYKFSA